MSVQKDSVRRLHDQDYHKIRAQCLEEHKLFEDPFFPPSKESFYAKKKTKNMVRLKWLRPKEISEKPVMFVDGASRMDVHQGQIGNCWFIGSVSCFAELRQSAKQAFHQVVPEDQGFQEDAGIFYFRFWQFGNWVEVVIDDRLPTRPNGQLHGLSSTDKNEYWGPLLEKAYAKLHGSYAALWGGFGSEAMTDLTGGFATRINLYHDVDVYPILLEAYEQKALIGCSSRAEEGFCNSDDEETNAEMGLVNGHFYSITCVKKVPFVFLGERGVARMLRLRNPWGDDTEWNGQGSDESLEWNYISQEAKEALNFKIEDDGEFWIPYTYFEENNRFRAVDICRMPSDLTKDVLQLHGKWTEDHTDEMSLNPQHVISTNGDNPTSVHIYLMEKNRRTIGASYQRLFIYVCPYDPEKALTTDHDDGGFFRMKVEEEDDVIAKESAYAREVQITFTLEPSKKYVVIPMRGDTDEEREYLLRVVHDSSVSVDTVSL